MQTSQISRTPLDRVGWWGESRSVKRISVKTSSGRGQDSACSIPAECELCSGRNDYAERAVCAAEIAWWRVDSGGSHRMVTRRNVLLAVTHQACCPAETCAGNSADDQNTRGQLLPCGSTRGSNGFPRNIAGYRAEMQGCPPLLNWDAVSARPLPPEQIL